MDDFKIKPAAGKGNGLFSRKTFAKNQTIMKFEGKEITYAQLVENKVPTSVSDLFLQIGPDLYLDVHDHFSCFVNHKCAPNCDIVIKVNNAFLVANQTINVGDEITFDYSLTCTESHDLWKMNCVCGNEYNCRKLISGFKYLPEAKQKDLITNGLVPKYVIEDISHE